MDKKPKLWEWIVLYPIASMVLRQVEWNHRKELLKDKNVWQKIWFYIDHILQIKHEGGIKIARVAFEAKQKQGVDKNYTVKEPTPESLVIDLLKLVPFEKEDFVVDAGSGEIKVWFNNIPTDNKDELEIDEGRDFLQYDKEVDWVVGNPPFRGFIDFIFKSSEICRKGFGFLTNHSRINQLTPRRLENLKEKGFYLSKLHIFGCKKWFGRYYFILWTKKSSESISWNTKNYQYRLRQENG